MIIYIYRYNIDMIRVCPIIRELHPIHGHFWWTPWWSTIDFLGNYYPYFHMVLVKPIISHFLKRVWEIGYGGYRLLLCLQQPNWFAVTKKETQNPAYKPYRPSTTTPYHPVFPLADLTGWCSCRFCLNMVTFHSYVIATSHCHRVMYPNTTYFRLKNWRSANVLRSICT